MSTNTLKASTTEGPTFDMAKRSQRFVRLLDALSVLHPGLDDPEAVIVDGMVLVDGAVALNPRANVRHDAVIKLKQPKALQGAKKLTAALDHFNIPVSGLAALDLGASVGGFTGLLVERGARVVYAIDAGFGQLLGSLRQHPNVRNLERTNLSKLTTELVPDPVDIMTIDLSYVAIATAIGQVEGLTFSRGADLIALVKPMYELGLGELPRTEVERERAIAHASEGIERCRWAVQGVIPSPVRGGRGAIEFLLHAKRLPAKNRGPDRAPSG
jgi:23S rRNA (cytidine1920-2'-O)/16S rRNA (cytidine1409-2'-O)-methyltransferase